LIADVGLVGRPNAGKSTLLANISAARPKIASYPFTTLRPNLGIVSYQPLKSFVVADIPGLIEGAHKGKGLGLQFLRHIERTRIIAYLIDPTDPETENPVEAYQVLHNELRKYSPVLVEKESMIVLTKKDIWDKNYLEEYANQFPFPVIGISAVTVEGLEELKKRVWELLEKQLETSTSG